MKRYLLLTFIFLAASLQGICQSKFNCEASFGIGTLYETEYYTISPFEIDFRIGYKLTNRLTMHAISQNCIFTAKEGLPYEDTTTNNLGVGVGYVFLNLRISRMVNSSQDFLRQKPSLAAKS